MQITQEPGGAIRMAAADRYSANHPGAKQERIPSSGETTVGETVR